MSVSKGFTLLEILVVMVIISISFGMALWSFGDFGAERQVQIAAEQLSSYIKLLQQQALIETSTWGLNINADSYDSYRFEGDHWQRLVNQKIFQRHYLPKGITMKMLKASNRKVPTIVIKATTEMNPFQLILGTKKNADYIHLLGSSNGQLRLLKTPAP